MVDAIKNNANLFIKEYYDVEETCMNKIDKEIEYSPFQMLVFCIGWIDLVLSWEDEEQKGTQETSLETEWKWNELSWLYQSFYDKYNNYSLNELINIFNAKVKKIIDLIIIYLMKNYLKMVKEIGQKQKEKNLVYVD